MAPDAPITGPYGVSTVILQWTLGGIAVLFDLPSTVGLVTDPSKFLPPAVVSWAVSGLLFVVIRRRHHHRPGNSARPMDVVHSG